MKRHYRKTREYLSVTFQQARQRLNVMVKKGILVNLQVSLMLVASMLVFLVGCTKEPETAKKKVETKKHAEKVERISVRLSCPSKKMAKPFEGNRPRPRLYSSAGFFVAKENGYYAEENLDVELCHRERDLSAIDAVTSGQDDFGVGGIYYVLKARDEGHPVVAISAIMQKNPLVIASLKDKGIEKPADLYGKTLGVYPKGWAGHASFQIFLDGSELDGSRIKQVPIYGKGAVKKDLTDARVALVTTLAPLKGTAVNIILFEDYGVLDYKHLIFTTSEMVEKRPDVVERFLRASLRGWQFVIENPEVAAKVLFMLDTEADEALILESMLTYIPLLHTGEVRLGWMENNVWETVADNLRHLKIIGEIDVDKAYDMRFLQKIYEK